MVAARRCFSLLYFKSETDKKKLKNILECFDTYFDAIKNVIYARALFNSRIQEEGEPIDEFITSLCSLAESCEYATLHDEMIRDIIVVGVRNKNLSERVQLDESLTLEKAVKTVRQFEAVRKQQDDLRNPYNSKSTSRPNAFLLTLAVLKGSEPWIETLKLDNIAIKMKLDTGADVIAIPLHIFKKKCKHRELRPANRTLREYFGQILKCAGMSTEKLKYGDVDIEEPIYVTYQMRETLLSGNTCVKLKLLVRLNSLKAATFSSVNVKREFPKHFVGIVKVGEPYKIKLEKDAQPFAIHTPRRVPIPLMEKLKTRLTELQNMNIVQPVQEATEWCAPTVIASKTNGDIRLCVDLSKLNIGIERETHPMPVVEHMLGQLGRNIIVRRLDLLLDRVRAELDCRLSLLK
ncbi:hypothetical protein LAZ67_13000855 [Cordylochernes scorpioides]|uniref:Peptidase A2 domain-containing protein n=1 Tax=Cordylochernes scorpioides TaxID=51811 RepID=A0ABY6L592_9ARAC|nr:hypothetical protein LAZ67_13000855 [Cordylochernes scorpioides]